jgi:hypothetical protein
MIRSLLAMALVAGLLLAGVAGCGGKGGGDAPVVKDNKGPELKKQKAGAGGVKPKPE